jgi:PAS domain S-box-containing protein
VATRVLILDDNVALAENLRDILSGAGLGIEATVAVSAARGLECARERPFDVAIVDLKLPDASGVDLVAPLRAAMPRCEIILLTGNATVESAIAAIRAGAAGFILKSFGPDELVATVEQALERAALRRERELYEKRYRALVNAAEVLIVGLDASGRVVFFNPKLAALVGQSEEGALGREFIGSWVDPVDHKRFRAALAEARDGEPARELEIGMTDRDGAVRRVRWHLSAVRDEGPSTPDHIYGIGIDTTAKRALERRAASAEALNAMAPLALGLAHEIRNPLNAAVLELHLLSRSIERLPEAAQRDPMRRRVEVVEGEIRRLERLLTEFLELARPRAPSREPLDLVGVVEEVLDLEREAALRCKVTVNRRLEAPAWVLGDVEKLKQVMLNLVVNALDAMPDGGELTASVRAKGDATILSLKDTGKGIDPRILAEVFDPFFTTKPAGTGLGLAIVRKIIEQHGGTVALATAEGEGTTIEVSLPSATPPSETRAASDAPR